LHSWLYFSSDFPFAKRLLKGPESGFSRVPPGKSKQAILELMIPCRLKTPKILSQNTPEVKVPHLTAGTHKHRLRNKRHEVFHMDKGFPRNIPSVADVNDLHGYQS
jgi:hypothetical protein